LGFVWADAAFAATASESAKRPVKAGFMGTPHQRMWRVAVVRHGDTVRNHRPVGWHGM
jgi:hypothetical protein